jgi:hypothetical protein
VSFHETAPKFPLLINVPSCIYIYCMYLKMGFAFKNGGSGVDLQ